MSLLKLGKFVGADLSVPLGIFLSHRVSGQPE